MKMIVLLERIALMFLRVIFGRYLVFNGCMAPCSIVCVMDVVLGGKEIKFATHQTSNILGYAGYAGPLSIIGFWTYFQDYKCIL